MAKTKLPYCHQRYCIQPTNQLNINIQTNLEVRVYNNVYGSIFVWICLKMYCFLEKNPNKIAYSIYSGKILRLFGFG